ncbi:MAG: hypothetical protein ACOCU4_03945, partial [Alkalispirochaeta sp.]
SALVVWAGELTETRIVTDTTGSSFLRYQRQLVPLVEPEIRRSDLENPDGERADIASEEQGTDGSPVSARAAVVIRIAGQTVALGVDSVQDETVVSTAPGGRLRLSMGADEWGAGIALDGLPLGR